MMNYDTFLSRAGANMQESAIRQMGTVLSKSKDMISFAPGYPAEDQFPWPRLTEIAQELLTGADGSVLQYGPTRGYRPLREATLELMGTRGISSDIDRVVITTGSQQGLDLVARVLLDPDDVVLMELPSYTGAITAFRNVGAVMVGVSQSDDGIDIERLDQTYLALKSEGRRIKMLYLVPNFQNPTGLMLSTAKRTQALEWAGRRDILIVEDDPYRDLYFGSEGPDGSTRPIAADDAEGRVVYLSSFSKTLAPGFRVGWLSAPAPLASRIEFAKQAGDLCTSVLDQRIVHAAWKRGLIDAHLPALRAHYRHKCEAMVSAINRHMPGRLRWTPPRGGFFLWAALTSGLESRDVMPHAQARGVIFVNGSAFFVDGTGGEFMRLSFSAPSPARIDEGIARLAAAIEAAAEARPVAQRSTP
jgi:2-aminoadipate transaminase